MKPISGTKETTATNYKNVLRSFATHPWPLICVQFSVRETCLPRADLRVGPGGPVPPFCPGVFFLKYFSITFSIWNPGICVQNGPDCISENFNLKNFPGGACARNSPEKCAIRSPDERFRAHITTADYVSRPPRPQNPLSAPVYVAIAFFQYQFSAPEILSIAHDYKLERAESRA